MQKIKLMTMLSVIPGLPLIIIGCMLFGKSMTAGFYISNYMIMSTVLGIAGSIGLVLASLPSTFRDAHRKLIARGFLILGQIAVVIAIAGVSLPDHEQQSMTHLGQQGSGFQYAQLALLLLYLSWPITAGVIAIHDLSKKPVSLEE